MVMVPDTAVCIRPIGVVISDFTECSSTYDYHRQSLIYIREDLAEALTGIEYFSHMHVIYHQHRRGEWMKMMEKGGNRTSHTVYSSAQEAVRGIYTTRSPSRPSALGSCVVEILKREGNRIYVKGLDALDGTPILDIKVYVPQYDSFPWAETPLNACAGNELITSSRHLNWDNINGELTMGLRTGARALQALGIKRGEASLACVSGSHFFALGIEGATGCSVVKDNMIFEEDNSSPGTWQLILEADGGKAVIRLNECLGAGAREVLEWDEDRLFAGVAVIKERPGR